MRCNIKDTNVYYEIIGEGTPILLLHGWSLNHQTIKNTLEPVFAHQPGRKRIYLDLPGHGKTPGTNLIKSQDQILELILGFIDRVIGEESFVVVGSSLGAYLARGVVYHKHKSIDGLLLIVPLINAPDKERNLPPHTIIVDEGGTLSDLSNEESNILELAVVKNQKILDKIRKDSELIEIGGDSNFQEMIRQDPKRYAFSFDVDDLDEPFMAPGLLIAGRQDSMVGYRDAWKILENYPRCSYVVLDRAGHLFELEQEELLHMLASEWLDRVEEYTLKKPKKMEI